MYLANFTGAFLSHNFLNNYQIFKIQNSAESAERVDYIGEMDSRFTKIMGDDKSEMLKVQ